MVPILIWDLHSIPRSIYVGSYGSNINVRHPWMTTVNRRTNTVTYVNFWIGTGTVHTVYTVVYGGNFEIKSRPLYKITVILQQFTMVFLGSLCTGCTVGILNTFPNLNWDPCTPPYLSCTTVYDGHLGCILVHLSKQRKCCVKKRIIIAIIQWLWCQSNLRMIAAI